MKQIAAKFMPRLLTDDQKQHWLEVSVELKEQVNNDPETKQLSSQRKCPSSPWPKKTQQIKSSVTSMLICFFQR
jgi:hypothetical protein